MSNSDEEAKRAFRKRNQEFAQRLVETMNEGPSAEALAAEEAKARQDKLAYDDYYRRTGQRVVDTTPRARSAGEMMFAASIDSCPHCRTYEPPELAVYGSGDRWSVAGPCPRCRQTRTFACATEGNPHAGTVLPRQLGDDRASAIITVGQFLRELDRVLPLIRERFAQLPPDEWKPSKRALDRAITCLYELLKFIPANMKMIPDYKLDDAGRRDRNARRERYQRTWLQSELERFLVLVASYDNDAPRIERAQFPTKGTIDRDTLRAHEQWLATQSGERLDVIGYNARGFRFTNDQFSGARLERINFDKALLDGARFSDAELHAVSANEANAVGIVLTGATIIGGSFARAALARAKLDRAVIDHASFEGANLDRSFWLGAQSTATTFDAATFGSAQLDEARFHGCSFKKADFHPVNDKSRASTAGTLFDRCDLRGTNWDGRNLDGARFIDCSFYGITGTPASLDNVVIEEPDLSPEGDGSEIVDAEDVLAYWR